MSSSESSSDQIEELEKIVERVATEFKIPKPPKTPRSSKTPRKPDSSSKELSNNHKELNKESSEREQQAMAPRSSEALQNADLLSALAADRVDSDRIDFYMSLIKSGKVRLTALLARRPWSAPKFEDAALYGVNEELDAVAELIKDYKFDLKSFAEGFLGPLTDRSSSQVPFAEETSSSSLSVNPVSLTWTNIGYTLPKSKAKICCEKSCGCCDEYKKDKHHREKILEGITGHLPGGKMLAIMGSSGAGKTTLLDVLAGRTKVGKISGELFVNGNKQSPTWAKECGYVMQDDAFLPTLTVNEALKYSLRLKFGNVFNHGEIIDEILDVLNLKKTKYTRIGDPSKRGISGGERKRLSIGVEMVTSPAVLFLDEPTSGLDSRNALRVMQACKALCQRGHTIVTTIHQPRSNIFHLFDHILLLHEGRSVYFGPRDRVIGFFNSVGLQCPPYVNPADFLLDVLEADEKEDSSEESDDEEKKKQTPTALAAPVVIRKPGAVEVGDLAEAFAKSKDFASVQSAIKALKPSPANPTIAGTSNVHQFATLVSRTWRATTRDSSVMYIRTFAALAIALLVGGIFFQQADDIKSTGARINTLLFLMCVLSLFCMPAIGNYIQGRLLFQRERAGGFYSTGPYYLASLTVEVPILLMIAIFYGVVSYWMVGLQAEAWAFVFFVAIIFCIINVGFSVSQVIGATVKTQIMGIAIYMIVLVYSLLLGGFIVGRNDMPEAARWLMFTSYFWYGFQGLIINEFEKKTWANNTVIADMDMDGGNKFHNLGILAGIWLGLQIIVFLILRFAVRERR